MSADKVGDLLVCWEELTEQGEPVTPEDLCRDCPELLPELKRRIAALVALRPALGLGGEAGTLNVQGADQTTPTVSTDLGRTLLIPGYEILGEVGRGGMGVVYKARQLSLGRLVALKMILAGVHAGTEQRARFHREAEAVATLHHPHIVQIYEIGECDGCPYLALEYVEGQNLDEFLGEALPKPRHAAALVEQLARAIDFAHRHGIVHRDLKPGNILLERSKDRALGTIPAATESGAEARDLWPRITDFGLAKRLDGEPSHTRTGDLVGTPSYMAPEQAAGKKEIGPATDIYALGAILYELLTGVPPFEGPSVMDTIGLVLSAEPEPPSRRRAHVPRDLETICLKCLRKEPERRYASALALAEDLHRFQVGEPIEARRIGLLERGVKWARRRPALATLLALSLVLLLGSGWLTALLEARNTQAHHRALVRLYVSNGTHYLDDEDLVNSLLWFTRALSLEDDPARRQSHRTRIAAVLRGCPRLVQLWCHEEDVTAVTFSPDGRWVLTASDDHTAWVRNAVTGEARFEVPLRHDGPILRASFSTDGRRVCTASSDSTAGVWDAVTGRRIATLQGHTGAVRDARFSPSGSEVVTAGADGTARLWDAEDGAPIGAPLAHEGMVVRASFHPDGKQVLTASADGSARVWRLASRRATLAARLRHEGPLTDATFSPDGRQVATASEDRTARLWDARTGKPVTAPLWHSGAVLRVAFRGDGRQVATAGADLTARVWDVQTGQALIPVVHHYSAVTCVAFSPDGTRLLTASDDNTARVWDAATGRPLTPPLPHNGEVTEAAFSPNGRYIATSSEDTTARIYDLSALISVLPPQQHGGPVLRVSFDATGGRLLTASEDGTARLWDPLSGKELAVLRGHRGAVVDASFRGDGRRIVTAGSDATARIWDAGSGEHLVTLAGHQGPLHTARFSQDGERVVTASEDATARTWDAASGTLLRELVGQGGRRRAILDAVFSPDGSRVATAGEDGTGRLWDSVRGVPMGQILQHQRPVVRVVFSSDGGRLATASSDRTARLWDGSSGQALLPGPIQHAGPVLDVTFRPDGARLATGSADNTAQVHDVVTSAALVPPLRHNGTIEVVRFSADGTRLATGSTDNTARVWDAVTGEPLTPALSHHGWGRITDIAFHPAGDRLATASADGSAELWPLEHNDWPAEDLERLAELLGGSRIGTDAGSLIPLEAQSLQQIWQELRTRHPDALSPGS